MEAETRVCRYEVGAPQPAAEGHGRLRDQEPEADLQPDLAHPQPIPTVDAVAIVPQERIPAREEA